MEDIAPEYDVVVMGTGTPIPLPRNDIILANNYSRPDRMCPVGVRGETFSF